MMLVYADPYAFTKLWIAEEHSEWVRDLLLDPANATACSAIGRVEIVGALRRAYKGGRLIGSRFVKIYRELQDQWRNVMVVQTTPELLDQAELHARRFALRGYDAVHLASILHLAHNELGPVLASFDRELGDAARKCGIPVLVAS